MNTIEDIVIILYYLAIMLLAYAALHDVMARTVPNWTNATIAALAFPLRILQGNLQMALLFCLFIFWILLLLWHLRLLGGGDVKLWVAATLLVPPSWQTECLALDRITLVGGIIALVYITQRRLLKFAIPVLQYRRQQRLWRRSIRAELWRMRRGGPLPYAVAISAGILMTLWPTL